MFYSSDSKQSKIDVPIGTKISNSTKIIEVKLDDIELGQGVRRLDKVKLSQIEASIEDQGLRQPIHVYELNAPGKWGVAAGRHRVQAMRNLGHQTASAIVISRLEAKAWQWSENLHRSNLRPLEYSEAIAGYATERENLPGVKRVAPRGGEQPNDKGFNKLAKLLRIDRKRVADAQRHAALPNAVKKCIRKYGELNKLSIINSVADIEAEKKQLKYLKKLRSGGRSSIEDTKSSEQQRKAKPSVFVTVPLERLEKEWSRSSFRKLYLLQRKAVQKLFVKKCM
ncbi:MULTISPECIES: ParB N-terminal domain-containing protein [Bradyrhizobium]|uniref:ParB/RepB/Spo0J family partition protein n=1 Tax=Bradyrhizobium TaxID=374 RepID=UPI00048CAEAB|nr:MULTISPECIES: ParB N-terminal domain-containing protein [Bradyrhizobium]UGY21031.1 ParB N-terminal domain-containing protein [Bradyrhizobium septentrionale]